MKIASITLTAVLAVVVSATEPRGSNAELANNQAGHSLTVLADAHAFGGDPISMLLGQKTSTSLGDPVYDHKMREEVANQREFFQGVPAEVLILDEQHVELRNAYANGAGKIYFGKNMFFYTINHYNELAVAGILAHEWGHRVQYTYGWDKQLSNPALELEADAISGFYMTLSKGFAWSQINGYFASTLSTGDYDVESPQHHGTPNQRVAAAYLGCELAIESVNRGEAFTYEELHHRIIDSLDANVIQKGDIAPVEGSKVKEIAEGKVSNKEIVAPVLSAQERKKYFPYENE